MDKAQLYEYIGAVTVSTNFAAYLIPALLGRKPKRSFIKIFGEILVPALVSMMIFISLVCAYNIFAVPNFLQNTPLHQFVFFNFIVQTAYALVAGLTAAIISRLPTFP